MSVEQGSWHSYPKVWNLGHPNLTQLFFDDVIVEEKIDGSQFSFGIFDGELRCRSRGKELVLDAPEKMFAVAVDAVRHVEDSLTSGWTYRAEYLQKPKHNTLVYDRVPENHLIVFDINEGYEKYMGYWEKKAEAERLGFECVSLLFEGKIENVEDLAHLLENDSVLGGCKVEGVVCKNYTRFGRDGNVLLGKHVSEKFKEVHQGEWKKANPSGNDIIQSIGQGLKTDARWEKAIQHLREAGNLETSPRDIGALIKEIWRDVAEECEEEIKKRMYLWGLPKIMRIVTAGLPEWYKERLLEGQFKEGK